VIKRIRFATRRADVTPEAFAAWWREAVAAAVGAPSEAQPLRVVVCTSLPEVTPDPKHDGIGLEWFASTEHVERYESWVSTSKVTELLNRAVDVGSSPVVVADEHVRRGAEWLEQRWRDGGEKLKHMAIALRAKGLTLAEFFELWQTRAGKVGTAVIPDEARGLAYIQNWPQPRDTEWAYDALNEVYFDDLDGLQTRIAYFAETLGGQNEDDLVREGWFLAAREELLFDHASDVVGT
jgi:hypothetical protein